MEKRQARSFNFLVPGVGLEEFSTLHVGFNNMSVILWRSVLFVEETGENHWPAAILWQTLSHNIVEDTLPWMGFLTHNFSGDRHWLYVQVVVNPTTGTIQWRPLRPTHFCTCPNLGLGFWTSYVMVFLFFCLAS
jgi:hypothetical protein